MDRDRAAQGNSAPIDVEVVRVFTDGDGRFGNELGIIWASAATAGREQQIARQLGFSETVFIGSIIGDAGNRRASIRIFTPASELPFAGHPSVGVAWWLARQGIPVALLVEKAGDVAVRYADQVTWISGEAAWAPRFEWMPLASPADVEALDPAAFSAGQHYAWAWIDEPAGRMRSRMFAPGLGIAEDEATGAAAVRITAELQRDLAIEQGRGSHLATAVGHGDAVHVGGSTVVDRTLAFRPTAPG